MARRSDYLNLLLKAPTNEREEIAIIELFKASESPEELKQLMAKISKDDLINDLDDNVWSLLITVGEMFGASIKIDSNLLWDLLRDADVVTSVPGFVPGMSLVPPAGLTLSQNGLANITNEYMAELKTAAQAFMYFIVSNAKGILALISEPQQIIEGIGQLIKLSVTIHLAQLGYKPAQQYLALLWKAISSRVIAALKGAQILDVKREVLRRVKWAVIL